MNVLAEYIGQARNFLNKAQHQESCSILEYGMNIRHYFLAALACALFSFTSVAHSADVVPTAGSPGLIELWASGQPAFGQYVTQMDRQDKGSSQALPPFTVQTGRDLAAKALLDFAFLSLEQHYDADSVPNVAKGLRSGGEDSAMTLLVRIPPISVDGIEAARARVKEVLAHGAGGVVLPHVQSAEEARIAVSFFEGVNVWSPANPDGDIIVMLLVEDPDVFAELEEIANIPGYSSLVCGIGSLTHALGGDKEAAEVIVQEVLSQSKRAGLADLMTVDEKSVEERVNQGFLAILAYGPTADNAIVLGRAAAGR